MVSYLCVYQYNPKILDMIMGIYIILWASFQEYTQCHGTQATGGFQFPCGDPLE
jgi:hypothetical protein